MGKINFDFPSTASKTTFTPMTPEAVRLDDEITVTTDPARGQNRSVPRAIFTIVSIICLAGAIIGAIALAGYFYPHSPLGTLGHVFGEIGASVTLGVGGAVFLCFAVHSIHHAIMQRRIRQIHTT